MVFLVLWGFWRDEEELALGDVGPVHALEKRMALKLAKAVCSESFRWIWVQKSLDQVLAFFCDFSFTSSDVRPLDLSFQDVLEDLLRRITSEWSNADNHFVGNDSNRKVVNHMIGILPFEDLRRNIIRSSEETMRRLVVSIDHELRQVEISKDKLAKFINHNVILYYSNAYRFQVSMNYAHLMDRVDS